MRRLLRRTGLHTNRRTTLEDDEGDTFGRDECDACVKKNVFGGGSLWFSAYLELPMMQFQPFSSQKAELLHSWKLQVSSSLHWHLICFHLVDTSGLP